MCLPRIVKDLIWRGMHDSLRGILAMNDDCQHLLRKLINLLGPEHRQLTLNDRVPHLSHGTQPSFRSRHFIANSQESPCRR